jgi:hypothetical protein
MSSTTQATTSLDLEKIIEDLFMVLSTKEIEVITKRFSLDNKPRLTLEKIGQKFGVTRERIRQIEKIALTKLRRTSANTKLKVIADLALQILNKHGGIYIEEAIVAQILETIESKNETDGNITKLVLIIHPEIEKVNKSDTIFPYYHLKSISSTEIVKVTKKATQVLKKKGDILNESKLLSELSMALNDEMNTFTAEFIQSSIMTDKNLKKIETGWGLMTWRHVNPKSIRDKAYIILKKNEKPMHFGEIAKAIESAKFDHKSVTVQAVHNELIRYEQFVLVGRGLYGLKEWGYKEGTVADIIEDLLDKKSPLTKQEITSGVLEQRHVKKGTISLNLQKNNHFVRVGRALYSLDVSKK